MIGRLVSHYKIIEQIGSGGMGIVYKAEDTKLQRTVALKFLPPELTRDPEAKERFIREAQAASALQHGNICTIHEINQTEDDQLFICMDYYQGENLQKKIDRKELTKEEAVRIAVQIARGLAEAHEKGIVHRDLKPANIFLTDEGRVKIIDFGLAKLTGRSKLTVPGITAGTVAYMSPEQALGNEIDQRTDVWALGVILFEMLTGRLPFQGEYEQAVIYSILHEDIDEWKDVPDEMKPILGKCLEKKAENRYSTMEELADDLEQISSGQKSFANRKLRRKRSLPALAAITLVTLVSVVYLINRFGSPSPDKEQQWVNSIAVLPFVDLSPAKNQDYFCMGLAEQILSNLARLKGLKVIARTSVNRYKNSKKTIPEIAGELDVQNILEGSIQRAGNKIRIAVHLIEASSGAYLWSENYDRNMKDIFAIQDEISEKVADVLNIRLHMDRRIRLSKSEKTGKEALEYYLKGKFISRYQILGRKLDEQLPLFLLGEKHFKKALQLDSLYSQAKLGLAEHYIIYDFIHGDDERMALARKYAKEVFKLEPENDYAVTLLGAYHYKMKEYDSAYADFKKALQLNPNSEQAHYYIGLFYAWKGLYIQALHHFNKAVQLDPLNSFYLFNYEKTSSFLGRFNEAEKYCKKFLEINPHHVLGRWSLIWIKFSTGKIDEAEAIFKEHKRLFPDFDLNNEAEARLLAYRGEKKKALALDSSSAEIYLILNMKEEAIRKLGERIQKSGNANRSLYLNLIHEPLFDGIRQEPRFIEIVNRQKKIYEELLKKYGQSE